MIKIVLALAIIGCAVVGAFGVTWLAGGFKECRPGYINVQGNCLAGYRP